MATDLQNFFDLDMGPDLNMKGGSMGSTSSDFFNMVDLPDSVWDQTLAYDHVTWDGIRGMNVVKLAQEGARKYAGDDLAREAFFGIYNHTAHLTPKPPKGLAPVHSIMRRAEQLPEFGSLRRSVNGDAVAAGIATARFVTEIMKNLPEEVKEEMEKHEKARQRLQFLRTMQASREGTGEAVGFAPGSGEGEEEGEGLGGELMTDDDLAEAIRRAEEAEAETSQMVEDALAGSEARMEHNLSKSMQSAGERIDQMREMYQSMSWGSDWGGGPLLPAVADDIMDLVEYIQNNPHLLSFFDMLGWAEAMIESETKNQVLGKDNLVDYIRGEFDPEQMAPEEFIGLCTEPDSPLMMDLIARFNGDILILKMEGEEAAGKGPVVMVKDVSGSTMGEVFNMESAIGFSLGQHLAKEHRRYVEIPFSGPGQFHVFDPGPDPLTNIRQIIAHLKTGYFGGTEPYAPLTKAIEIIKADPDFKKGYILMLTDGEFSTPPPAFLKSLEEARKDPGLEIYTVVIGAHPGAADSFSDKVIMLSGAAEKDKLIQIVAPVL